MNYLYWYLGIGVAVLAVVYAAHFLTKDKAMESLHAQFAEFHSNRKQLSYRILNKIVAPTLTIIFIVILWPIAFVVTVKMLITKAAPDTGPEEQEFTVDRDHLLDRLTIQEIEKREVVTDPLDAVPEFPFGHLNAAWTAFLEYHTEGDVLWSFTARWQPKWGRQQIRSGYVIVHDGVPGAYLLTMRKEIPGEVGNTAKRVDTGGFLGWLRKHAD
ncbi:MAG: hypothetical protein WCP99_17735, partial [Burkholderiales bacterium]